MQRFILPALSALSAVALLSAPVSAQTDTWTGAAFTGLMSTNGNWADNSAPVSGSSNLKLVFGSFGNASQDIATPLILQVVTVPEPAALALMAFVLGAVVLKRRQAL